MRISAAAIRQQIARLPLYAGNHVCQHCGLPWMAAYCPVCWEVLDGDAVAIRRALALARDLDFALGPFCRFCESIEQTVLCSWPVEKFVPTSYEYLKVGDLVRRHGSVRGASSAPARVAGYEKTKDPARLQPVSQHPSRDPAFEVDAREAYSRPALVARGSSEVCGLPPEGLLAARARSRRGSFLLPRPLARLGGREL